MDSENSKFITKIGLVFFAFVILLTQISKCQREKDMADLNTQLANQRVSNAQFRVKIKSDSSIIADQQTLILENNKDIQKMLKQVSDGLKDVQSRVEIRYITEIESVLVPYDSPVYLLDSNAIMIPLKFKKSTKDYFLGGSIKKEGILFDSLAIPNKLSVTIGKERKNIWEKPETIVRVQSSNPYVRIDSMNNIVLKDKKVFYERPLFWSALSLTLGFIFGVKL